MLSPKGHEANPTELFQAVVQQNVRELQALIGRRAEKYGPATIREAQIAVSEVLGRLHFLGCHLQKRWKTDLMARRIYDEESLKKVAVFHWSNKF